jgi:hydroxymethylbilane synthase
VISKFRIGTRPSLLATTQTEWFAQKVRQRYQGIEIELVAIRSEGDNTTTPLSESKTPGIFVSALRDALLNKQVDVVVHSMKDLPSAPHPLILTGCTPEREDPRDALVSRGNLTLAELPAGAIVGTSSPRRAATIRASRPDLIVKSIRGNVDSRIAKVRSGEFDATVLALAGLKRIGRQGEAAEIFAANDMIPAPGQGALAVECRAEDLELAQLLDEFTNDETRFTTAAERAVLLGLGASCQTAIGAFATLSESTLRLVAELAIEETGEAARLERELSMESFSFEACRQLGLDLAKSFLDLEISKRAALN